MCPLSWRVFYQRVKRESACWAYAEICVKCTSMNCRVVCFDYPQYTSRLLSWNCHFSKLVDSSRGVQQQKHGRFKIKLLEIIYRLK
jgi:hypothetical protein